MLDICYHNAFVGESVPLVRIAPTFQCESIPTANVDGNGVEHGVRSSNDHDLVPQEASLETVSVAGLESNCCSAKSSLIKSGDDRLRSSILYIHQHLNDAVGVQDVIRHVGVSRRWLEYAFRDAFGISPYQYLRRVRLELARSLLVAEPQKKIYQIARSTGFSSARQFTMTFRQYFGLSPTDCRRGTDHSGIAQQNGQGLVLGEELG
ncbi:MAG: AraC family transcriptional regulator [Bythopirellula sp.]|nr:AraC family transcriptional regulator [Bythopirellula sp.]